MSDIYLALAFKRSVRDVYRVKVRPDRVEVWISQEVAAAMIEHLQGFVAHQPAEAPEESRIVLPN